MLILWSLAQLHFSKQHENVSLWRLFLEKTVTHNSYLTSKPDKIQIDTVDVRG